MKVVSAIALAMTMLVLLTAVALAQGPVYFVPVVTEQHEIVVMVAGKPVTVTIEVKGSNVLTASVAGVATKLVSLQHITRTAELTSTATSSYYVSTATTEYPAGKKSIIDVVYMSAPHYVETSKYTEIDLVVRNNTGVTTTIGGFKAEAYSAAHEFIGTGSNTFMPSPTLLGPGEISYVDIVFDDVELLEDDIIEVTPGESFLDYYPLHFLQIGESKRTKGSLAGVIVNDNNFGLQDVKVQVRCVDKDELSSSYASSADMPVTELDAGKKANFRVKVDCEQYIIYAQGRKQ